MATPPSCEGLLVVRWVISRRPPCGSNFPSAKHELWHRFPSLPLTIFRTSKFAAGECVFQSEDRGLVLWKSNKCVCGVSRRLHCLLSFYWHSLAAVVSNHWIPLGFFLFSKKKTSCLQHILSTKVEEWLSLDDMDLMIALVIEAHLAWVSVLIFWPSGSCLCCVYWTPSSLFKYEKKNIYFL